jgi:nitrate reductase NapAB chaperone NapD
MTNQEQQLIQAIKALPNHQVYPGSTGGAVIVAITTKNSVKQLSVWLNRSSTVANLERILQQVA